MNTIPTSVLLNGAADRIQMYGWRQGNAGSARPGGAPNGSCASNAILRFARSLGYGAFESLDANEAFSRYIGGDGFPESIFRWNDAAERTEAEVVAALRACAAIEASREALDEPVPYVLTEAVQS